MKKYLLPLILILFLTFTLGGYSAWLSGWDYRIELQISDYAGDIGGSVTWFPVTVFLNSTQGEEVFAELTTDAEYLKVAFTKADGTTELYAEKELFDVAGEKGIFHISRDGWTINANTSIYMYYDAGHADNNTYIGAIGSRTEVWDGNFKFVSHMVDDMTSTILDSTSNNNDGTKTSANNPIEIAGKVGKGQDFSNDHIDMGDVADGMTNLTLSCIFKADTLASDGLYTLISKYNTLSAERSYYLVIYDDDSDGDLQIRGYIRGIGKDRLIQGTTTLNTGQWYLAHLTFSGSTGSIKIYLNTIEDGVRIDPELEVVNDSPAPLKLGARKEISERFFDGIEDEIRISDTVRDAAWRNAEYNSAWDTLLTYGSEEEAPITVNAIFFGMNF